MAVITFSRSFPAYHPKAGKPTHFVEQILNELGIQFRAKDYEISLIKWNWQKIRDGKIEESQLKQFAQSLNQSVETKKLHTIRSGHRRKKGDKFYPVVWSGVPYNSPQIIFAPETEVKQTWKFDIDKFGSFYVNGNPKAYYGEIAKNDGFNNGRDFLDWFKMSGYENYPPKPFDGQIICWDDNLKY